MEAESLKLRSEKMYQAELFQGIKDFIRRNLICMSFILSAVLKNLIYS